MSEGRLISIVVPVFNNRSTIVELLRRISALPIRTEIIVVDDGSSDGTTPILRDLEVQRTFPSARYFIADRHRGQGSAVRSGVTAAQGETVIIQPADSDADPEHYPALLEPILSGNAEVVYGSHFPVVPHRVLLFWNDAGNRLLTLFSNMAADLNLSDGKPGCMALRRDIFTTLKIEQNGHGFFQEITAKLARSKYRIYEAPVFCPAGVPEGKGRVPWRDGVVTAYVITKYNVIRQLKRHHFRRLVILLVCITAFFNLNLFEQQTRVDRSTDDVAGFERSLQQLRDALPKRGTIGYVSGRLAIDAAMEADETRRYFLTEYSLVPLIIESGTAPDLVIGNFYSPLTDASSTGLVLVRDFGNGMRLFRKRAR